MSLLQETSRTNFCEFTAFDLDKNMQVTEDEIDRLIEVTGLIELDKIFENLDMNKGKWFQKWWQWQVTEGGGGFLTCGDHWFVFWTCIECGAYINVCQFCFWFTSSSQFIFNNFKSLYLFLSLQIMQWQLRNSTTLQLLWKFVIDLFCMLKFKCLWTIFVLVYWVK